MKKLFSTSWKASGLVRKQRKFRYNAPLHIRHSFLSANLSKDLRAKYTKRSLPVRVGDEVRVMRGAFAGKKAKVVRVDTKKTRVFLDGITRQKKDGTKLEVPLAPSRLQIISVHTEDKKRFAEKKGGKTNASNKISSK